MHQFETIPIPPGAVGIWWFGQSSFALKDTAGTIVQVDPFFPRVRPPEKFVHAEPPLDLATLRTDYVLLTHNHSDHTCIESLQRIHAAFPDARYVGPAESIAVLSDAGVAPELLITIDAGQAVELATMTAHAVWAKPPGGDPGAGIRPPDVQHLGYVVRAGDVGVYISGDLLHTFAEHAELIEPVAALRPDIGLLTMHPSEGEFPFVEGSVRMARRLELKAAVPAHYDCFVQRTYDPHEWARHFTPGGPQPAIIDYNSYMVYQANDE